MFVITNADFALNEEELSQLNAWAEIIGNEMDCNEKTNAAISVTFKFSSHKTDVTAVCGWVTSRATKIRN